jgi:hypothetical protein
MSIMTRSTPTVATAHTGARLLLSAVVLATVGLLAPVAPAGAQAEATSPTCRPAGGTMARLAIPTSVAAGVVAMQRAGDARSAEWAMARESDAAAVLAHPSSTLHALGSYHLARQGMRAVAGGCRMDRRAIVRGVAYATLVGVAKEAVDGWYTGFSRVDLVANGTGIALAAAQAAVPALRHVQPTVSVSPAGLASGSGSVTAWGAQTYWLSASVHDLLPDAVAGAWPSAVRLSVGRRAGADGTGGAEHVLALDLDAGRLPGSHPAWRKVKETLGHVRLPGPALVVGPTGARTVALYW